MRIDLLEAGLKPLSELVSIQRQLAAAGADQLVEKEKLKPKRPSDFHGARNAKELENFIYSMEDYFEDNKVVETEQLRITKSFLEGDAKLWWRTKKHEDIVAGRGGVVTHKQKAYEWYLVMCVGWLRASCAERSNLTPLNYILSICLGDIRDPVSVTFYEGNRCCRVVHSS